MGKRASADDHSDAVAEDQDSIYEDTELSASQKKKLRFQEPLQQREEKSARKQRDFNDNDSDEEYDVSKAKEFDDDSEDESAAKRPMRQMTEFEGEESEPDELDKLDASVPLEPFNLKSELQEGYFDEDGNYVEYRLKKDLRDAWLDDYEEKFGSVSQDGNKNDEDPSDEKNGKSGDFVAAGSRDKGKRVAFNVSDADEDDEPPPLSVAEVTDLQQTVLGLLHPGETVLQALRRLKGVSKPKDEKKKGPDGKKKAELDDPAQKAASNDFNQLTEAADKLLQSGQMNVYQDSFERFDSAVRKAQVKAVAEQAEKAAASGAMDTDSTAAEDECMWEYKWSEDSSEVFGPYKTSEMLQWSAQGYFSGGNVAWIRQVQPSLQAGGAPTDGEAGEEAESINNLVNSFVRSDTVRFDLYV